jgi:hypothetical protein
MSFVHKRARELEIGDKIMGNTNWILIEKLEPGVAGVFHPKITGKDAFGKHISVDTGATGNLQDTTFEVEPVEKTESTK